MFPGEVLVVFLERDVHALGAPTQDDDMHENAEDSSGGPAAGHAPLLTHHLVRQLHMQTHRERMASFTQQRGRLGSFRTLGASLVGPVCQV